MEQLRTLAISNGVSIVIVSYAKKQFIVAHAMENPYAAVSYAKKVEPVTDGAGVLLSFNPNTYSLVFREKAGIVRRFDSIVSFR